MKKYLLLFLLCSFFVGKAYAGGIKTSYRNALVFAYSKVNSVYEDENIKLEIYDQELWATNKTQKTIFIDLSQCFVIHNGSSYPIYAQKQDERHASKAKKSTSIDEYLSIAPKAGNKQNETFICNMGLFIYGIYTTYSSPSGDLTEYDKRLFNIISELTSESLAADPKGKQYLGTASRHLTEDESINNIGASIAYAFNKKSEDWTSVSLSTWVSDVIFAPCYVYKPGKMTEKEQVGFAAKESKSAVVHIKADSPYEFDEDKSPFVVADWEGKFKKGMFVLSPTTVYTEKFTIWNAIKKSLKGLPKLQSFDDVLRQNFLRYKSVISFDGAQADWGKMSYAKEIQDTEQDK